MSDIVMFDYSKMFKYHYTNNLSYHIKKKEASFLRLKKKYGVALLFPYVYIL